MSFLKWRGITPHPQLQLAGRTASAQPTTLSGAEELFNAADKYEEKGDLKNAFKCLLAAAQSGHVGRQTNLGNFYASEELAYRGI